MRSEGLSRAVVESLSRKGKKSLFLCFRLGGLTTQRLDRRGVAMITVVIVMLTMALIGAALAELSSAVNYSVESILDQTKARYLAEAGIAHALHELRSGADLSDMVDQTTGEPVFIPLGDGGYNVIYDQSDSLITSTGVVNGTKKTLQLQYNVF